MGFYENKVLPRVVEFTCGSPAMAGWRRKATAGLFGTVLEVGFGSGMNIDVYPPEVERVLAVEPSELARSRSDTRHDPYPVPVEFVGITGESIP
ncbi:MAG: SAM-dependent methyltransferase, partial [Aquihabitans sp.]